jgi:hypothetical protein
VANAEEASSLVPVPSVLPPIAVDAEPDEWDEPAAPRVDRARENERTSPRAKSSAA